MFNLDLKRAAAAIEAGRLDDAFRLLRSSAQTRHADGQQLIDRLVDAYLDRAEQHFCNECFPESRTDVLRAQKLGGNQVRIAQLIRKLVDRDGHYGLVAQPPVRLFDGNAFSEACSLADDSALNGGNQTSEKTPLVLQVDQLGGLFLLRSARITVGTVNAKDVDVVLQTEGPNPHQAIHISRDGHDYFAECTAEFLVNGVGKRRHLLAAGDSLQVGSRGRLKFTRPVRASGTAVLQITGSKMKRRDIRSIVLLDDALIIGPAAAHFRLPRLKHRIVVRPNRTNLTQSLLIHQQGHQETQVLDPQQTISASGVQFSLANRLSEGSAV